MSPEATPTTVRTCAGPGCDASLAGRPATARYCGETCRKAAFRARARAEGQTTATTGRRSSAPRVDPEQAAAAAERFARLLRAEAEASLRRDPIRWPWRRSIDTPRSTSANRAARP